MQIHALTDPRIAGSGSILTVDETKSLTDYILTDGSRPLTANWDVGNWKITAQSLTLDGTFTDGTLVIANGILSTTGIIQTTDNINLRSDSNRLEIGNVAGGDLVFWHNGSNSYIENLNTGDLHITNKVDEKDIVFTIDSALPAGPVQILRLVGGLESGPDNPSILLGIGDNIKIFQGAGLDVSHYFDGEDLIFNNEGVTADAEILFQNFSAYRFDKNVVIGAGAAGVDYTLTFDGEDDDCVITYDEDNNVLNFGDTDLAAPVIVVGSTLTLATGSITDSSGTISFDNENLNTRGILGIGIVDPDPDHHTGVRLGVEVARADGIPVLAIIAYSPTGTNTGVLKIGRSDSNVLGSLAITDAGEILGRIEFTGVSRTQADFFDVGAEIYAVQNGAAAQNRLPADLVFTTGNTTDNPIERMRIDKDGVITWLGDTYWIGSGSGVPYGEIYTDDNATDTVLAAQDIWYDVTIFSVNGLSNLAVNDHTDDTIKIVKAGVYMVNVSLDMRSSAANAYYFSIFKNKVAGTEFHNLETRRTTTVADKPGSVSMSGLVDVAVDDTISLGIKRTDGGGVSKSILLEHANITITMKGGT